ncbi:hypothetical protein Tco_1494542, partial [Tanacetum coccineum]
NYGVICEDEAKWRNSGAKTKTFEENSYLLPYAISNKEDTTYQRQLITRIHEINPIRRMHLTPYGVSSKEDMAYQRQLITRISVSSIIDSAYHS